MIQLKNEAIPSNCPESWVGELSNWVDEFPHHYWPRIKNSLETALNNSSKNNDDDRNRDLRLVYTLKAIARDARRAGHLDDWNIRCLRDYFEFGEIYAGCDRIDGSLDRDKAAEYALENKRSKKIHRRQKDFKKINWPPMSPSQKRFTDEKIIESIEREENEIRQRFGLEPIVLPKSKLLERYSLLNSNEITNLGRLKWRVKRVIPETGVASIYGPSGSGKSFLAMDLVLKIAKGQEWFSNRTTACPILYVALEGEAGIANRVAAYRLRHRIVGKIYFLTQPFSLFEPADIRDLAEAARSMKALGGVLVIDTLNRAAPGMDENSSSDMGRAIAALKELQSLIGGLVLVIHHTGKDANRGMRGHSSLHAALDAAIELRRDGNKREWLIAKSKDGEDGMSHPFRLDVVELGIDDDGDAITSCVVVPQLIATEDIRSPIPKGGNQKIIFDGIKELLGHSPYFGKAGATSTSPVIQLEDTVQKLRDRLAVEPDRKTERTRQAITGLIASGLVNTSEGWLWLA